MKAVFSLQNLFPGGDEYLKEYSYLGDRIILAAFTVFISLVGLVGNGKVIWLLGFRVKRKLFATYILNLAIADFGSLVVLLPLHIFFNSQFFIEGLDFPFIVFGIITILFLIMYCSSQFLLTTIGIDRCVCVLFPHWYQCHRSPAWSTTVCALLWALSLVLNGGPFIVPSADFLAMAAIILGTISICLFLMILSTLTLFIKVCFRSQPCQCGNLLKVVLLMLLSFLLFNTFMCVCVVMDPYILEAYLGLGITLKNSINPLIYFLAGRQKGGTFWERIKVILMSVFKEGRDTRMELQPCTKTQL